MLFEHAKSSTWAHRWLGKWHLGFCWLCLTSKDNSIDYCLSHLVDMRRFISSLTLESSYLVHYVVLSQNCLWGEIALITTGHRGGRPRCCARGSLHLWGNGYFGQQSCLLGWETAAYFAGQKYSWCGPSQSIWRRCKSSSGSQEGKGDNMIQKWWICGTHVGKNESIAFELVKEIFYARLMLQSMKLKNRIGAKQPYAQCIADTELSTTETLAWRTGWLFAEVVIFLFLDCHVELYLVLS